MKFKVRDTNLLLSVVNAMLAAFFYQIGGVLLAVPSGTLSVLLFCASVWGNGVSEE